MQYRLHSNNTATIARSDNYNKSTLDISPIVSYGGLSYSVIEIAEYAFIGNISIKNISIPESVTVIGDKAFMNLGASNITVTFNVSISNTSYNPPTFGLDVFTGSNNVSILVPDFALGAFKAALLDFAAGVIKPFNTTATEYIPGTNLSAYPNPTDDAVTISGLSAGKQVSVYSMTGALINTYIVRDKILSIDVKNLEKGVYVIVYEGKSVKFVKK